MIPVLTAEEMLWKGLELAGFDRRYTTANHKQLLVRFKAFYGSEPIVYAQIWEDLLKTNVADARVPTNIADVDAFLLAIHFLKVYPTENNQAALFRICEKTARKWAWYYARKIQALKAKKVCLAMSLENIRHN